MVQGKPKDGKKRFRPKGTKRLVKFKTTKCGVCGKDLECVYVTKTLKCWDCKVKMIKDYQHKNTALLIHTNYAEAKGLQVQQQQ